MYALVKFIDNIHYVCSSNSIYITKSRGIKVKYSDGFRYSATIIAKNGKKNILFTKIFSFLLRVIYKYIICYIYYINAYSKEEKFLGKLYSSYIHVTYFFF